MSLLVFVILMGFPTVGALTAWVAALRSLRTARGQIPPGSDARGARGRLATLLVLPSTLILFGLVVPSLVLGETIPDSVAEPAALAYGVPSLLAGLGMAIIYWRGIPAAVASNQGFGRVLPLAVTPGTSAVLGLVVSFFLIGVGTNFLSVPAVRAETAWLASLLAMVAGLGGPLGAWLAASAWDFKTKETWPRALAQSRRGDYVTALGFALAMVVLGEWLIVVLIAVYFAATLALGSARLMRARRKRLQDGKAS